MSRIIWLTTFCLVMVSSTVSWGETDKIRQTILDGEKTYEKTTARLKKNMEKSLQRALSNARRKGNKPRVDALLKQAERFRLVGAPPTVAGVVEYMRNLVKSRKKLENLYLNSIRIHTRAGRDDEASRLQRGLDDFRFSARFLNGKQYFISNKELSWHDAQRACQQVGGHLVIITSQADNDFITRIAQLEGLRKYYFIGATDRRKEGNWVWVNGRKMTWSNWDSEFAQPNNRARKKLPEHYAAFNMKQKGKWWDLRATVENTGFICQWD